MCSLFVAVVVFAAANSRFFVRFALRAAFRAAFLAFFAFLAFLLAESLSLSVSDEVESSPEEESTVFFGDAGAPRLAPSGRWDELARCSGTPPGATSRARPRPAGVLLDVGLENACTCDPLNESACRREPRSWSSSSSDITKAVPPPIETGLLLTTDEGVDDDEETAGMAGTRPEGLFQLVPGRRARTSFSSSPREIAHPSG